MCSNLKLSTSEAPQEGRQISHRVGTMTSLSADATIMSLLHTPYILGPSHSAADNYFVHSPDGSRHKLHTRFLLVSDRIFG